MTIEHGIRTSETSGRIGEWKWNVVEHGGEYWGRIEIERPSFEWATTCQHNHKKPETAAKCARKLARTYHERLRHT